MLSRPSLNRLWSFFLHQRQMLDWNVITSPMTHEFALVHEQLTWFHQRLPPSEALSFGTIPYNFARIFHGAYTTHHALCTTGAVSPYYKYHCALPEDPCATSRLPSQSSFACIRDSWATCGTMSTITNLLLSTPTPTRVTLIMSFSARDCWTQRQHLRHVGLSTEVVWYESFHFVYPAHCKSRRAQTIRQPAGNFVLQGTPPAPQCTVYASTVHLFLSGYMRHKLKTCCMTLAINAHTTTTRVRALHSDWRSTWERGCEIRKAEFAKHNPDG